MMQLAVYIDEALHSLFDGASRGRPGEMVRAADRARDQKEWTLAAQAYAEAINSGAVAPGVKVQLGHALKEMGDLAGAEAAYRQFLHDHPDDADIHLQLGHLFNKKGDFVTALEFYERANRLAPDEVDIAEHLEIARNNVGRIDVLKRRDEAMAFIAAQRWEEGRRLLRTLVAIDGEKDLIGVLANVTKEAGRLDEAEALYDAYLRYSKCRNDAGLMADCHMQLGHLNKIKGDQRAALGHFLEARKIRRNAGEDDIDESDVQSEILCCLRGTYPCFVFQG